MFKMNQFCLEDWVSLEENIKYIIALARKLGKLRKITMTTRRY